MSIGTKLLTAFFVVTEQPHSSQFVPRSHSHLRADLVTLTSMLLTTTKALMNTIAWTFSSMQAGGKRPGPIFPF